MVVSILKRYLTLQEKVKSTATKLNTSFRIPEDQKKHIEILVDKEWERTWKGATDAQESYVDILSKIKLPLTELPLVNDEDANTGVLNNWFGIRSIEGRSISDHLYIYMWRIKENRAKIAVLPNHLIDKFMRIGGGGNWPYVKKIPIKGTEWTVIYEEVVHDETQ
jgi:hypothetical protein